MTSRLIAWGVLVLSVLVLIPLIGMIAMTTIGCIMGGTVMNGPMEGGTAGMMGMQVWTLFWMVLLAAALIGVVVRVIPRLGRV